MQNIISFLHNTRVCIGIGMSACVICYKHKKKEKKRLEGSTPKGS